MLKVGLFQNAVGLNLQKGKPGVQRGADISKVDTHDAAKDMLTLSKTRFRSKALNNIGAYLKQVERQVARVLSVPGTHFIRGFFLIPNANIGRCEDYLIAAQKHLKTKLVPAFKAEYPSCVAEAMAKLGEQADEADYPSADVIADEVHLSFNFMVLDVPSSLPPEIREREQKRAEKMWADAAQDIRDALRVAMLELVKNAEDNLQPGESGKEKTFRKNGFDSVKKFLDTFDVKNITNDAELALVVSQAKKVIAQADPKTINESKDVRGAVASKFKDLKAVLDGMVTERAKRQFSFDEEQ